MDAGGGLTSEDIPHLNAGWCAAHTRHQHEKIVAQMLTSKGFEVFLPLYTAKRRWRDRTKQLSLPLFPCYLFLRGIVERRPELVTTPGLISILGNGTEPAIIPESQIDAVRQVVDRGTKVEPYPFLASRDWVRVKSGPLEGIEGVLVRRKNHYRLVLSVELLQKSAAVEVDVSVVERIANPRHQPALTSHGLATTS